MQRRNAGTVTGFVALSLLAVAFAPPAFAAEAPKAPRGMEPLAEGKAHLRAGRPAEAETAFRRAVAASGTQGEPALRARWELAHALIEKGEFKKAMAQCGTLAKVRAAPAMTLNASAASHACAAEAHLLWRRGTEALVETEKALSLAPGLYEAKVAEGLAKELELRDQEAEDPSRGRSRKAGEAEARIALGRLLVRTGKRDEGVRELRAALKSDERRPEANYELGRALASEPSQRAEGLGLLRRALEERPAYEVALLKLAEVELEESHPAEARTAAEKVLALDSRSAQARIVLARAALAEARPDDALREAGAALALASNSATARLAMAEAYAQKKEVDLAIEQFEAAVGLDATDPTAPVRASQACLKLGRPTSARAFAAKATEDFPNWAPGHAAMGDVLQTEGDKPGAKLAYERALRGTGPVDKGRLKSKLEALAFGR